MVLDLASRVDGMVILGRTVDDDVVAQVAATGKPLVLLARSPVAGIETVTTENTQVARGLADHLLAHGHRRFVFLGDEASSPDIHQRWEGFCEALAAAGVEPPRRPIRCAFDEEAGREAALRVLGRRPLPDVLVCANDEIALGAVLAAESLGLRIPDDVAVTGWDDVMAARYARPALTTVRQPMRELGAHAARRLHERITGDRFVARHDVLPTQLVIRASCGFHHPEGEK